ncbi:hypothetical protein K9L67_03280 [Candidatus Woesearchaeota archaeon]|nr:hypothetical protein [Candidatus Woesearchaeota archaeon]MCF7901224.1 hypothetical protein [Candidatus Woesearchaeota archaeon]MCF8013753.1 hypothetical protein [Candidatus Woesearchaeota archaeon]
MNLSRKFPKLSKSILSTIILLQTMTGISKAFNSDEAIKKLEQEPKNTQIELVSAEESNVINHIKCLIKNNEFKKAQDHIDILEKIVKETSNPILKKGINNLTNLIYKKILENYIEFKTEFENLIQDKNNMEATKKLNKFKNQLDGVILPFNMITKLEKMNQQLKSKTNLDSASSNLIKIDGVNYIHIISSSNSKQKATQLGIELIKQNLNKSKITYNESNLKILIKSETEKKIEMELFYPLKLNENIR